MYPSGTLFSDPDKKANYKSTFLGGLWIVVESWEWLFSLRDIVAAFIFFYNFKVVAPFYNFYDVFIIPWDTTFRKLDAKLD